MHGKSVHEGESERPNPASDGGPSAAERGWTLTLTLAAPELLLATLSDGEWYAQTATGPWPAPAGSAALPAAIARDITQVGTARLRLQLPTTLDRWPWERELAGPAGSRRIVPRHLIDLPPSASTPPTPTPLVAIAAEGDAHLALVQAARRQMRPLVLLGAGLGAEQRVALERGLHKQWRDPLLLSDALAAVLAQLALAPDACRLYGDGRAPVAQTEQGWRPATALSIDVVNSTPLLQTVGAEVYAQRLQAYHERCRDVIIRFQGSLDVPQGDDGLMAYFGFPVAVEDAAARALSAAWQLARGLGDLELEVRIGVASGQVAVSAQQAFGSDVHLAARLRAAAQPGQILVAPSTRDRAGDGFLLERCADSVVLKDYASLEAVYRLAGLVAPNAGTPLRAGAAVRFVGRQRETEQLRQAWDTACAGRLQWRVILGEAGIGKSRLLQEFARELRDQGQRCLEITGQPQSGHSPFAAVIDTLRRHWQVEPGAGAAALTQHLSAALAPSDGGSDDAADLARLLAAPHDDGAAAQIAGSRRASELLLDALVGLIGQGPFCVLVDDAHWLDPSTVELLRRLRGACAERPVLVVAGERTESGRAVTLGGDATIELQGLSAEEARELVGVLGEDLPSDAQQLIVERAEGVPLYLEESLRMLHQRGAAAAIDIPATLEDLLMVRLDGLGPDRGLAQLISVMGRECSEAQLQALLMLNDPFIERASRQGNLASLLNSGLLDARDTTPPGYRFKHALIRDAAYRSIWTDDRRRLHGLCAKLIVDGAPALWPQREERLAHHLEAAGRPEEARRAWIAAAQRAAARHAHRETIELTQRALALQAQVRDDAETVRSDMQLQLLIASARIALHGYSSPDVEDAYHAAERAGQRLTDLAQTLRIRLGLEACYVMRGDLTRAGELARSAVAATEWTRDPRLALQARWAQANVQFHAGDWQAALAGFDDCLAHYRPALHRRSGVQDPAIMCLGYSSWIHFELGQADEALDRIERGLALARELQHPFSTSVALGFAASIKRLCGDVEGAWPHALEAVQVCERGGFQAWLAHAWMVRGQLRVDQGDVRGGEDDMTRGYRLWFDSGARISCATYLITAAELLLRQGRTGEAVERLDEAWRVSEQIGEHYYQAELLRLQALCRWQADDLAEAESGLQHALALAERQRKPGLMLRCALSLGALEAATGRCDSAARRLRALVERTPRHGRCRDARWAQTALGAWARGRRCSTHATRPWEPT